MSDAIQFDNTYRRLPERFYQTLDPTPVDSPELIEINQNLADTLGIKSEWLASKPGIAILAGNEVPKGAEPIASVYAGHQFGNWNPRLGDGRAVLLGEVTTKENQRFDLQLKGSGPTLFSRGGDGRAPLGPVLREYIVSEAMFHLGIKTSRALGAVRTGEMVMREETLPGAVLLRVASSHIRFGSFQYFASIGDWEAVRLLADHVIDRHYPEVRESSEPYLSLFKCITDRTAKLVTSWQAIGFIHGVMNTDNMLVCGETIDYGPCAFLDTYHPETVFSSIDVGGRYAYQNQPGIAHWNLAALAQCFAPLLSDNEEQGVELAKTALDEFPKIFYHYHRRAMANKLGLSQANDSTDELTRDLLSTMADQKLDYTNTFTLLRQALSDRTILPTALENFYEGWNDQIEDKTVALQIMQSANPVIVPRNHIVEAVLSSAHQDDMEPFRAFNQALANPFSDELINSKFAKPPIESEIVQQTFCGT